MTPEDVLRIVASITAGGLCIASMEQLSVRHLFSDGGIYNVWIKVGGKQRRFRTRAAYYGLLTILIMRLLFGFLTITAAIFLDDWKFFVLGLAVTSLIACSYLPHFQDGAQQLALISLFAISLTMLSNSSITNINCIKFLSFQLCLAYVAAGVHKLCSPHWCRGEALPGILSTRIFGCAKIGKFLGKHSFLARSSEVGVTIWELTFPLVLLVPFPYFLFLLCVGLAFHLVVALTMGLNGFIWAFGALYPAVVFLIIS